MATRLWAIVLVIFCTLLTSSAQILLKFGAAHLPRIFSNLPLLSGLFLYAIAAVALIISFKGGEVTVLYPIIATSYVWVALLSKFFFNESLSWLKFVGIFSIMLGICCIGGGSKKDSIELVEVP